MDWLSVLQLRIRERNQIEIDPYKLIYSSHATLYKENKVYDYVHRSVKLQLLLLQYELNERAAQGDLKGAVNLCDRKVYIIQEEFRKKEIYNEDNEEDGAVVSKLIMNLKKRVSDQSDELAVAKSELTANQERISLLEKELESMKLSKNSGNIARPLSTPQAPASIKDRRPSFPTSRR